MLRLEAEWDKPFDGDVQRAIVITSSPRSGSNLICRMLWDSGIAGAPDEYFDGVRVQVLGERFGLQAAKDLPAYLTKLTQNRTTPNGVFGIKFHWHQFQILVNQKMDIRELLPNVTFVRTTRSDEIRQTMSYVRGMLTGEFSSERAPQPDPDYSLVAVATQLEKLRRWEAAWDAYYADLGIKPYSVNYEEFTSDIPNNTRALLKNTIGDLEDGIDEMDIPSPSLKKQEKPMYAIWHRAFVEDLKRLEAEARAGLETGNEAVAAS